MKGIAVVTDLHIGKGNDSEVYSKSLLRFAEFLSEYNMPDEVDSLILNGDTTQNYTITPKTMKTFREFGKLISKAKFSKVIFNLGNHDIRGRKSTEDNSIDIITSYGDSNVFGCEIEIVREPTEFVSPFDFMVFPYRTHTKESVETFTDPVYHFTHQDRPADVDIKVLNGHIHLRGEYDNILNLGACYQLDSEQDVDDLGFHIAWEDGTVERVKYEQSPLFIRVAIEKNKIKDENAIKWISNNREMIKNAHSIVIRVDHDTSKSNLEKFKGVLSTINSNFEVIDEVKYTIELDSNTESKNFFETMKTLIPSDAHRKLQEIYQEAST